MMNGFLDSDQTNYCSNVIAYLQTAGRRDNVNVTAWIIMRLWQIGVLLLDICKVQRERFRHY